MSPFFIVYAVKLGRAMSGSVKASEKPLFTLPKRGRKPEITQEMENDLTRLQNIAMYDGTSNGQKEIKRGK